MNGFCYYIRGDGLDIGIDCRRFLNKMFLWFFRNNLEESDVNDCFCLF